MNKQKQTNYATTLNLFLHDSTEIKNPVIMADILFELHKCESSLNRYYTILCERDITESENKSPLTIKYPEKIMPAKIITLIKIIVSLFLISIKGRKTL